MTKLKSHRAALATALDSLKAAKASAMGYDIAAATEFEFIVLNETAESLRAKNFSGLAQFAPDNRCWIGLGASAGGEAGRGSAAARADCGMKTSGAGGR